MKYKEDLDKFLKKLPKSRVEDYNLLKTRKVSAVGGSSYAKATKKKKMSPERARQDLLSTNAVAEEPSRKKSRKN